MALQCGFQIMNADRGVVLHEREARNRLLWDEQVGKELVEPLTFGDVRLDQLPLRVDLLDERGHAFAVGLVSYPASEIQRMKGRQSEEFQEVLGYKYVEEIIHREDLVLLDVKNNGESFDDGEDRDE